MVIQVLKDPNIVYLILVVGLWLAAAAVYVPGTGLVEALAGVVVIAGVVALASMPTNWLGVLLVVLGVMIFLVVPFIQRRLAPLAVGGLLLQFAGGLLLFNNMQVSWLLIAVTVGIQLGYLLFVLLPILQKVQPESTADPDAQLIGSRGRVLKALDPIGTVQAGGEIWTATSNRTLTPGTEIVVVDREGLQLYVEAVKSKRAAKNTMEEKAS
jgi:membrane-bound serine protease (ClpP class)